MDTLIHADVFFFVTTIVVVLVGAALTVALIYLAKILSDLKKITGEVHEEAILFRKDLNDLRGEVKREGFRLKNLASFFTKFAHRRSSSRSKKT